MTPAPHDHPHLEGTRWKAVRWGLRLANNHLGVGAIGAFHALWCVIGLILACVLIPFAVLGKMDAFERALNPAALYGFVLPLALLAAGTWAAKLFSRVLWCGIPKPWTARILALASTAGRLSVLVGLGYIWFSGTPFGKGLLLLETFACSMIAWLGLVADWGFIRTLRQEFIPATDRTLSAEEASDPAEDAAAEAGELTEQDKKGLLRRDFGQWFKRRFPKGYKLAVWILLPVAYLGVTLLANVEHLEAVPGVLLKLAVIAPAFLQIFWIPGKDLDKVIQATNQP